MLQTYLPVISFELTQASWSAGWLRPTAKGSVRGLIAPSTTWRAQRPRHQREHGERSCHDDVPLGGSGHRVRNRRPGHVEEDAGIRPFFETWTARREQNDTPEHFPEPDDPDEVQRVAEQHHAFHGLSPQSQFRGTP